MTDLPWSLRATTAPLGIAGRVSDAKHICDQGGITTLHICPATGNAPTRMTRASWDRLCAATQRRQRERECVDKNQMQLVRLTKRMNTCSWCQGKVLPRELEFIDAAELAAMKTSREEETMGKPIRKKGECELCGAAAMVTRNNGQLVCSSCTPIQAAVKHRLPAVASAARHQGKGEELLGLLVGPEGLRAEVEIRAIAEIAGIVGYEGEDWEALVEAVRKRVLTCASCEAEEVLHEIREIIGYSPDTGDSRLPEVIRAQLAGPGGSDCLDCATLRGDLLRASGISGDKGWDVTVAAAVQEIAHLQERAMAAELRVMNLEADRQDAIGKLAVANGKLDLAVEAGDDLRDRLQESQSRLLWYREALQVLRQRLGLDELGADEDVVERMLEAIASQAQALTRFQELARHADLRADQVEAELRQARSEIEGLRDQVAAGEVADALDAREPEPAPSLQVSAWGGEDTALLANFGRRVLRGEVAVEFRGTRS